MRRLAAVVIVAGWALSMIAAVAYLVVAAAVEDPAFAAAFAGFALGAGALVWALEELR